MVRPTSALADCEDAAKLLLIHAAQTEARYILKKHLNVIEALVTKLCKAHSMSGGEVLAFINRAGGKAHNA
jgi:hypothetical protein